MSHPAFVPVSWVRERLGFKPTTFSKVKPRLFAEGFPKPDPLVGRYLRDDVEAWIEGRRTIAPNDSPARDCADINFDAL